MPFVRLRKSIPRDHIIVAAATEHSIENEESNNAMAMNGGSREKVLDQLSPGLLAVHGGEREGRPKVSGMCSDHYGFLHEVIDVWL